MAKATPELNRTVSCNLIGVAGLRFFIAFFWRIGKRIVNFNLNAAGPVYLTRDGKFLTVISGVNQLMLLRYEE